MYIIFFIKVKASNSLYRSSFFHCHLTGFLKDTSLHLCRSASSFLLPLICSIHFRRNCTSLVFFKVRKSSSVALESTSINFIFFRTYYLFNQFIKNRQENFCNRKCYIPTAKDDNSNYKR